jgi:hypothetical protein
MRLFLGLDSDRDILKAIPLAPKEDILSIFSQEMVIFDTRENLTKCEKLL